MAGVAIGPAVLGAGTRHLPPRTPAPPEATVAYVCPGLDGWSWGGLVMGGQWGMYPGREQMSSTGADDGRAYSHARHLILMCCISALYK